MSRINLLPPQVRRERASAGLARKIRVSGLALAALLLGLYGIRAWQVLGLRGELEAAQTEAAGVQAQIDTYAEVVAEQQSVEFARGIVTALLAGEVSWSEQMLTLASTVPSGFALTSVSGTVAPQATTGIIGSIAWSATSSGYVPTEAWLTRLDGQEGWANGWAGSVQGGDGGVTTSGSVDLTSEAITPRGGGPA